MKRILVVEDEASIRENLKTILELNGYEVEVAEDGLVGISTALEFHPDLIISDILMPQLDGRSMVKKLRKLQLFADVPIIFLTAKVERADFREGMESGAEDYITKPFKASEIIKSVEVQLAKIDNKESRMRSRVLEYLGDSNNAQQEEIRHLLSAIKGGADILQSFGGKMKQEDLREITGVIGQSADALVILLNLKKSF